MLARELGHCRALIIAVFDHDIAARLKVRSSTGQDPTDGVQTIDTAIQRIARLMA